MGKLNVRFTDSLITHVQIAGKEFDSTVSNVARAALKLGLIELQRMEMEKGVKAVRYAIDEINIKLK